jgi:murein DD-endopeptidase MepM/ murein hydrolase activator NlpD
MALLALALAYQVQAQTATPEATVTVESAVPTPGTQAPATQTTIPRIHTVEEGETLTSIALFYGVTVEQLLTANNLDNADLLSLGQQLTIPGAIGEAVGTRYLVQAGDTVAGIAALFRTTPEALIAANQLILAEPPLLLGQPLAVVSRTGSSAAAPQRGRPHVVAPGETLLTIAARYRLTPQQLAQINQLPYPTYLFNGQRLRVPSETVYRDLPEGWVDFRLTPATVSQGTTLAVYVENVLEGEPSGRVGSSPLQFTRRDNGYVALVGFDAFTEPGVYTVQVTGMSSDGERPWQPLQQSLTIQDANFGTQFVTVGEALAPLLAPEVRANEDAFLQTIFQESAEEQLWEGLFQLPITNTVVSAGYGDSRSYNNGPIEIFHTGVDFAAPTGTPVLAPANGVVVFSDLLELRGMVVIIDHGLGVMSAYFHLSEIAVEVGQEVVTGATIGAVGSTGLSSGPHLHWDMRIHGVAVQAPQWTTEPFP